MPRVLIQQVLLNKGHLSPRADDLDYNVIKEVMIPSVKKYADKYGYDHNVSTDMLPLITKMEGIVCDPPYYPNMRLAYQKYLLLEKAKDYDYIVLVDCDCLFMNHSPELPLSPGVSVRSNDPWRVCELERVTINNRGWITNAGFYIFDKNSAERMLEFITQRIDQILDGDTNFQDELELAVFLDRNLDIQVNEIGNIWNHIRTTTLGTKEVEKSYMYHYAGAKKYKRWCSMIANGYIDDQGNWLK